MSFLKLTTYSGGSVAAGTYRGFSGRGHWNPARAFYNARRLGVPGPISVEHSTTDLSGHGRGSEDGRYEVTAGPDGVASVKRIAGYVDVDDSDDVHAMYDEVEG